MIRIEDDADSTTSAMCKCGAVWLTAPTDAFDAEGRRHGRAVCFEVAR